MQFKYDTEFQVLKYKISVLLRTKLFQCFIRDQRHLWAQEFHRIYIYCDVHAVE
jgi:hypothetical protein